MRINPFIRSPYIQQLGAARDSKQREADLEVTPELAEDIKDWFIKYYDSEPTYSEIIAGEKIVSAKAVQYFSKGEYSNKIMLFIYLESDPDTPFDRPPILEIDNGNVRWLGATVEPSELLRKAVVKAIKSFGFRLNDKTPETGILIGGRDKLRETMEQEAAAKKSKNN